MEVFEALGRPHVDFLQSGHAFAVLVDRSPREVEDGPVGSDGEAEIAIAELVAHSAPAGRLGGDALDDLYLFLTGIEGEQVAGIAMDAIGFILGGVPDDLAPVVAHAAGIGRIIMPEIIHPQVHVLDFPGPFPGRIVVPDIPFRGGPIDIAVPWIHEHRTADDPEFRRPQPGLAGQGDGAQVAQRGGSDVIVDETPVGPGQAEKMLTLRVHGHRDDAVPRRSESKVLDAAR